MGYSIMIDPKDQRFICQNECLHSDCEELRKFIKNAKCDLCKEPILPNERYYSDENNKLTHFVCKIKDD